MNDKDKIISQLKNIGPEGTIDFIGETKIQKDLQIIAQALVWLIEHSTV